VKTESNCQKRIFALEGVGDVSVRSPVVLPAFSVAQVSITVLLTSLEGKSQRETSIFATLHRMGALAPAVEFSTEVGFLRLHGRWELKCHPTESLRVGITFLEHTICGFQLPAQTTSKKYTEFWQMSKGDIVLSSWILRPQTTVDLMEQKMSFVWLWGIAFIRWRRAFSEARIAVVLLQAQRGPVL